MPFLKFPFRCTEFRTIEIRLLATGDTLSDLHQSINTRNNDFPAKLKFPCMISFGARACLILKQLYDFCYSLNIVENLHHSVKAVFQNFDKVFKVYEISQDIVISLVSVHLDDLVKQLLKDRNAIIHQVPTLRDDYPPKYLFKQSGLEKCALKSDYEEYWLKLAANLIHLIIFRTEVYSTIFVVFHWKMGKVMQIKRRGGSKAWLSRGAFTDISSI